MQTSEAGNKADKADRTRLMIQARARLRHRSPCESRWLLAVRAAKERELFRETKALHGGRPLGFSLLELLVVIAIAGLASAGVAFALRDNTETALAREAQRLAGLLDTARAQSRANGNTVRWHTVAGGFRFEGLASEELSGKWLVEGIAPTKQSAGLLLGPEPMIGPQAVELFHAAAPHRVIRVATDGVRPFSTQMAEIP